MSRTPTARLAAFLVVASWLALGVAWFVSPVVELPPERDIEPGHGFAIVVGLVLPYAALSSWMVPAGILALLGRLPVWLTVGNALVLGSFGLWARIGGFDQILEVLPWLFPAVRVAPAAACGALVLLGVLVAHHALLSRSGRPS